MTLTELISLHREPREPDAPVRVWRDWAVVAIVVPTAIVEAVLRRDILEWPWVSLTLCLVLLPTILWRRTKPAEMALIVFGIVSATNIIAALSGVRFEGLGASIYVILVAYAVFRWGSGRDMAIGTVALVITWITSLLTDYTDAAEAIGGLIFLVLTVELGMLVRYLTKNRQQQVRQAQATIREDLARELHDTVAHHVSAIALQAQGARAIASSDPSQALAVFETIENEASRALSEMRTVVGALRRADEVTYSPQHGIEDIYALSKMTPSENGANKNIKIDVQLVGELGDVQPILAAALYRIAQESVTNTLRHATGATRIDIEVCGNDDDVSLTVTDDGIGPRTGNESAGYGLIGMSERAGLLGGTLDAGPTSELRGWTVSCVLPRQQAKHTSE